MVNRRNARTGRRRNRRSGGRGAVRNTRNRKVVVLHRHPRRNVPKRLPTLGYGAGGISSSVRVVLDTFKVAATKSNFSAVVQFSMKSALEAIPGKIKLISILYTNFQILRVTFRVVSMVGSDKGGIHAIKIYDDSMGYPSSTAISVDNIMTLGGATGGKLWNDVACEWVPTEPEDLNYRKSDAQEMGIAYAARLPTATTTELVTGILFADIQFVARTVDPTNVSATAFNMLKRPAFADDSIPIGNDRIVSGNGSERLSYNLAPAMEQ